MADPSHKCIVCSSVLRPWFQKMGRRIYKCPSCGHISVPRDDSADQEGAIYESDSPVFEKHGNEAYYLDEGNLWAAQHKLEFVKRFLPTGSRLLDAGANYGHFLKAAADDYRAVGCDISPAAVAWSRERFGVDNHVCSVYSLAELFEENPEFEAITCWDTIEHLDRPDRALQAFREALGKEGRLFISTPDAGSIVARLMGTHWHYLDPVQHLNVFTAHNLERLLDRHGFAIEGRTRFGRSYRIGYIVSRLSYLYLGKSGDESRVARSILSSRPFKIRARVKLGDVIGLALRLKKNV